MQICFNNLYRVKHTGRKRPYKNCTNTLLIRTSHVGDNTQGSSQALRPFKNYRYRSYLVLSLTERV